jgi:hypothetical protein
MRYVKCSGIVLSIGESTINKDFVPGLAGNEQDQIVAYKDADGFECKVNILHPNVKNVVIK